jgi:hypothetical protein
MTKITNIDVLIQTGDREGAGTDGDVYAGVAGREFYLDTEGDDFERGSRFFYRLGDRGEFNERPLVNPGGNDPRKQELVAEEVDNYPIYIRFEPQDRDDNWNLELAVIGINRDVDRLYDSLEIAPSGIWLGTRFGLVLHLGRYVEPRPIVDRPERITEFREMARR